MNKIINSVLMVSISVAVFGLIIFGGNYNPFGTVSQQENVDSSDNVVMPTVTIVNPTTFEINTLTEKITSKNYFAESVLSSAGSTPSHNAFSIPSTQLTVTITDWTPNLIAKRDVAVDSSNNVWWTEQSSDIVGRLDPVTNIITRWSAPPPTSPSGNGGAFHIGIDNSDNVWWTELNDNDLLRLDPTTNTITEWDIGSGSLLLHPAFDSLGNTWFVEKNLDSIGRLDLSFSTEVKITASDGAADDRLGFSTSISGDTVVVGARLNDDAGPLSGSAYVFDRNLGGADNWGERKKLIASDAATLDFFGTSVSISGDTVVVGATRDSGSGSTSGFAYVFDRNLGGADNWGERKKLIASDAAVGDTFGSSVSISGDTIAVGAGFNDDNGGNTGSAYVFERNLGGADNWGERKKLIASDAATLDFFGTSVSISGDTVVVGATRDSGSGSTSGFAYVFDRNLGGADNWGERKKLIASDAAAGDIFGDSVSISGDTMVVGAPFEDSVSIGSNSGSAYVFERNLGGANNWGERTKFTASDIAVGDQFSKVISISGDTVVAGSPQDGDAGPQSGSAYVFDRNLGGVHNWGQVKKLTASDATAPDQFGTSVSISGDTAVVGSPLHDHPISASGAIYRFDRNLGGVDNWGQVKEITASDAELSAFFGVSVSISGDTIISGAYFDDGVASDSGSAYVIFPTNTITKWHVNTPSPFDDVNSVEIDSSNIVWYTKDADKKVGRLDPSTNIATEWDVPTTGARVLTLTFDASGNIYFVEDQVKKIGKLNPTTNEITEWTIPGANPRPQDIVIDSLGTVYFPESGPQQISRLVPATNVITQWSLPGGPNVTPSSVALDSNDDLWFQKFFAGTISRLS